ncbi:MAG TPA: acetate uptake transporter [Chloroflexota bacterium]|nr:acetate uptake transporter [Chloroflexota bacterium]
MASIVEHWTHTGPVHAPETISRDLIAREEVRAAATAGEPAALGLLGFATGTFTLSAIATGFFEPSTIPYAVPVVLVFAGLAQFIAAMWSFRRGDTLAATAFGPFGSFNVTFALYELLMHPSTIGGSAAAAPVVGIWIAFFAYIALMLFVGALRRSTVLSLVLLALAGTYGFLAADVFVGGGTVLMHIAGWCGIVSSILAVYVATATVINSENQSAMLPIGSMHPVAHGDHTFTPETRTSTTTVREPVH